MFRRPLRSTLPAPRFPYTTLSRSALRGAEIVVLPLCGRQLVGIHQAARRLRHDHELRPARAQRGCESPQLGHALGAHPKLRAEIRFGAETPAVATLLPHQIGRAELREIVLHYV